MIESDEALIIAHPGRGARTLGAAFVSIGAISLGLDALLLLRLDALSIVAGVLGLWPGLSLIWYGVMLCSVRWDLTIDRRWGTVRRRGRGTFRKLWDESHRLGDFEAVELQDLTPATSPTRMYAVKLVGPDLAIDVDRPEPLSGAVFFAMFRLAAIQDRPGMRRGAEHLASWSGLAFRDATGPVAPWAGTEGRLVGVDYSDDETSPPLVFPRFHPGLRAVAATFLLCGSYLAWVFAGRALPFRGIEAVYSLVMAVAMTLFAVAGLILLVLRSEVRIDRGSGLVRRRTRVFRTLDDRRYRLADFEGVMVRAVKVPGWPFRHQSVDLVAPGLALVLYDGHNIPPAWKARGRVARGEKCLRSAMRVAGSLGLPLWIVETGIPGPAPTPA